MAEQFVKITDDEKIKTAEKYKIEGNELFKVKDLKKAMGKYHRAVLQLKGVGKETNVGALFGASGPGNVKLSEENQQKFDKLKVDCFNNLSGKHIHATKNRLRRLRKDLLITLGLKQLVLA